MDIGFLVSRDGATVFGDEATDPWIQGLGVVEKIFCCVKEVWKEYFLMRGEVETGMGLRITEQKKSRERCRVHRILFSLLRRLAASASFPSTPSSLLASPHLSAG